MNNEQIEALIKKQAGKTGLRGKINAKCIDCLYDPISGKGSWKQQIEACTSPACPLFDVRPVSKSKTPIAD